MLDKNSNDDYYYLHAGEEGKPERIEVGVEDHDKMNNHTWCDIPIRNKHSCK